MEYTVDRFWTGVPEGTVRGIVHMLREDGEISPMVLGAPSGALPCLVMLAAWARKQGRNIVQDYDTLIKAMEAALSKGCQHPDTFFVSCLCVMHRRGQDVSVGGFESIGIPAIYEQILGHDPASAVEQAVKKASKPARAPDELDRLLDGACSVDAILVAATQHPAFYGWNAAQLGVLLDRGSVAGYNPGLQRMHMRNRLRSVVSKAGAATPIAIPGSEGKKTGKKTPRWAP